jgi:hypothetical protein
MTGTNGTSLRCKVTEEGLPEHGFARGALAVLAAWFAFVAVDFVSHGVVLAGYWRSTAEYWRPATELFHLIPLGYASAAIYCGGLYWLFS